MITPSKEVMSITHNPSYPDRSPDKPGLINFHQANETSKYIFQK